MILPCCAQVEGAIHSAARPRGAATTRSDRFLARATAASDQNVTT